MQSYQPPRISDDILERLSAKDRTLVDDLTINELVEIYNELSRVFSMYVNDVLFTQDVLIPEKTVIMGILTRKEWKSLRKFHDYYTYIAGLLNYFGNEDDKKGIEALKRFILREKVDIDVSVVDDLRTSNPYVFKLLIDLNPQIISEMFSNLRLKKNISLLTDIFSYAKDKISKEYVLKFLDDKIKLFDIAFWGDKSIMAMIESGIIDFTDLYNIILKYNSPRDIRWANKIIETQI